MYVDQKRKEKKRKLKSFMEKKEIKICFLDFDFNDFMLFFMIFIIDFATLESFRFIVPRKAP